MVILTIFACLTIFNLRTALLNLNLALVSHSDFHLIVHLAQGFKTRKDDDIGEIKCRISLSSFCESFGELGEMGK
jgi:hypothetical protein